ncbi:MAG: lysozyme inhibitor LprI family protein, partial [Deltaproteobacteria bacterium]
MRKMILVLMLVLLPAVGWAASFDCGKAQTKVEKLVCDTSAISKLDDEISKLYQETINKASEEQKQLLIAEQKHWLKHTRNVCGDETCLKLAYWSRQAWLATFFEPKSPLYKHEADKAEAIKQVLATAPLYYVERTDSAINQFCNQMFDDLKQMKGIRFVDPVVQTQSYEDPALDKWKQRCEAKPPLHFNFACEPRIFDTIKSYKDALETPGCGKGFGLPPFKLYELPPEEPTGKPRTIIYADDSFGSTVWEHSDSYTADHWEMVKPKLGRGYSAGFQQVDIAKCE